MDLSKYLNNKQDLNLLKRFSTLGSTEAFDKKLLYLTRIAEEENWYYEKEHEEVFSVIFYYIVHTFDRVFKQGKINVNDDETTCVFNTGLMSSQGDEILGVFNKSYNYDHTNPSSNYWHFSTFYLENERKFLNLSLEKPDIATYFEDFNELYFDPNIEISLNFDHFYDDNYHRLPTELKTLDKDTARIVFNGFLGHTIKKIKRNNRIPVPQFYREKIMFLIPVKVFGTRTVVIAVEKLGDRYVANTVLTMNMAYNCARLINKPESNWLLISENDHDEERKIDKNKKQATLI